MPRPYTLKQAFFKKCLWECRRQSDNYHHYHMTSATLENDMLLEGISDDDKQAIINYYEYANNSLSSSGLPPPYNK